MYVIFTKNAIIVKIMYQRVLLSSLEFLAKRPVIVLTGARRVGKTTLLREWVKERKEQVYWLNGDNPAEAVRWQRLLSGQTPEDWLRLLLGDLPSSQKPYLLVIDEAQLLEDVSKIIKYLTDQLGGLRVVLSGSAALRLKDLAAESLAGRKVQTELYPLSFGERVSTITVPEDATEQKRLLQPFLLEQLVWGGYPELPGLTNDQERSRALREIVDAVLYRDLYNFLRDRDAKVLSRLLVELARMAGGKLNLSKLSATMELSRPTLTRYLTLLQESGIVYLLPGVKRTGIIAKAQPKVYLLDNGLLSMLLNDERLFELHTPEDQGKLLENFLVTELLKQQSYTQSPKLLGYLWSAAGEIDVVLQKDGAIKEAWEVKRSAQKANAKVLGEVDCEPVIFTLENAVTELLEIGV
jgi:uncharacterized protein